jgi:lysozyme family protein
VSNVPTHWGRALAWIRRIEGGFSDHPDDPGGPTYAGVSQRAVVGLDVDKDGRLDFDLDADGDVDAEDIRALRNHPEKVADFFRERYWHPSRASELPWPLALFHFDAAVHSGVEAAAVLLQRGLGVRVDAKVGPQTAAAARTASPWMRRRVLAERGTLMARISARRGDTFLRGWMQRLVDLQAEGWSAW